LGIRIDAVPGKMYSVKIPFLYYGVFVGQCSEVCGLRHAYMPISISFLPWSSFSKIIYVQLFSSVDLWFSKYSLNRKSAY
jgi:cytochrome c oxidase subunit 2